jgi:hypothetical protein
MTDKEIEKKIENFKKAFSDLKDCGVYIYPTFYEGEYIDSEDDFEFYTKDWRKIK